MEPRFSSAEKQREAEREVEMRKTVYARNAPGGTIPHLQRRRIELMQEIADDYREKAETERLL